MVAEDFDRRRAPYAPTSALKLFFERIRDRQVPEVVDQRTLAKMNVASNNEYALLSALKFLGVLDDRGRPTHAFRLLQTTDRFQPTLRHLVETAYKPVFDAGADAWTQEDLINYFRVTSSASQAKNAARFFYSVRHLAGIDKDTIGEADSGRGSELGATRTEAAESATQSHSGTDIASVEGLERTSDAVLAAKAQLVEKLPVAQSSWSASDYADICRTFLAMMQSLDFTSSGP